MIYKDLGLKFITTFYESEFVPKGLKLIKELKNKGILKESEGALIADLNQYQLGVLVFLRSDGTALYPVADLPLAIEKFKKFNLDKSIYVVDLRQTQYFKQLFKILNLLGYKKETEHLGYNFVKLPNGMMASRTGNVITYDYLKKEMINNAYIQTKERHKDWDKNKVRRVAKSIAFGAIKFEMLKVGREQEITFNIKESLRFEGFTATYLQYTVARISSIVRKASFNNKCLTPAAFLKEFKEKQLLLKIAKFPEVIISANFKRDPSELAKYLFELAQQFNDYYHSVPILKAETDTKLARIELIIKVKSVIKSGLEVFGIEILEEM